MKDRANVVIVDIQEPEQTVTSFARQFGVTFPMALDADGKAAQAFGVSGIPSTFVLDPEGRIVDNILGAADEARLTQALEKAGAR